ncbi:hypothetical protein YN1HA_7300 [Sulfurisphaera ohwakuensis]
MLILVTTIALVVKFLIQYTNCVGVKIKSGKVWLEYETITILYPSDKLTLK